MLGKLLNAKRLTKRVISLLFDTLAISTALYLSISLRLGELLIDLNSATIACFALTIATSLLAMIKLGLYRAILRYAPLEAVTTIFFSAVISTLAYITTSFYLDAFVPRSSPIIYFMVVVILLGTPRLLIRNLINISMHGLRQASTHGEPLIIYGAGYSGFELAQKMEGSDKYQIVAFIDDDTKLQQRKMRGIDISAPSQLSELHEEYEAKKLILSTDRLSKIKKNRIVEVATSLGMTVLTIPPTPDILSGKAKIEDIKPVSVEDLLGREAVPPQTELLDACIKGKAVMVTGAGGSIGSELCRKILQLQPSKLILLELSEFNLYTIEQELQAAIKTQALNIELYALTGSVQSQQRLASIMSTFGVQTLYHAAAYKHVPLVEHNMVEGVYNNVLGTWYCAEAAIASKVESFVLISTDKAVRPTNIMGTTKRLAELVLQALSKRQSDTRFTMVRFGNVLGSSGSVVPLFRKQIAAGGPLTITHPDITRYFMTIPEASELVIQAGSMGVGGDVFVLDMGEPVKIVDLAKKMVQLSGLELKTDTNPTGDIEITYPGLRPGEKLYEELLIGDNVSGTGHSRIMRAQEKHLNWKDTSELLGALTKACDDYDCPTLKELLLNAPTDFTSNNGIEDYVWSNKVKNSDPEKVVNLK